MRYIEGHCRIQRLLLPDLLDDYVTEEHPVRFMDAYVESLDLASLGFARAHAARTGRPADAPRDVLKRYIDGYLNRSRSSRRLEIDETFAPGKAQVEVIAVAHTEHCHMNTRDLIPLHRRSQ